MASCPFWIDYGSQKATQRGLQSRFWREKKTHFNFGDLGGGGGEGAPLSSGIRPSADPKGPPLYYYEIYIFGWLTLKIL